METPVMQAWWLDRFGNPDRAFALRPAPIPVPGPGQIGIRVQAFGINYADIMARQGLYRGCPPLPCILGYDVEGIVDQVGEGVTRFSQGDRVFALTRFGGYAQYAVTDANAAGHLPAQAPAGLGCALAVHGVTAFHAAVQSQTLLPGEKVLIHAAAGGLGTCLVQIALAKGCTVIGVTGSEEKSQYLRALGVQHVIDRHRQDYRAYVRQYLEGKVDVVFDNVGGVSVQHAKSMLAPGGRLVALGVAAMSGRKSKWAFLPVAAGFGLFSPISYMRHSQSFIGINMLVLADARPDMVAAAFSGVQQYYAEGILQPHVGQVFPAALLPVAQQFVSDQKAIGKVVVKW